MAIGGAHIFCIPSTIRFNARDFGNGLIPEQLAHLFQLRNRLGQEADDEPGVGVELVVSKHISVHFINSYLDS